ncbi:hypothetical protein [Variovorax boronicumulans]|uniref:hypothetical protein n=1 Tax=Variovorax boronicumulans TaxID=436515 RepID=UPI0027D7D529|nr:hypothetical protein [Variovorax boronicumulans]
MGSLTDSNTTARKLAQGRRSVVATPTYLAAHGTPKAPSSSPIMRQSSTTRAAALPGLSVKEAPRFR